MNLAIIWTIRRFIEQMHHYFNAYSTKMSKIFQFIESEADTNIMLTTTQLYNSRQSPESGFQTNLCPLDGPKTSNILIIESKNISTQYCLSPGIGNFISSPSVELAFQPIPFAEKHFFP